MNGAKVLFSKGVFDQFNLRFLALREEDFGDVKAPAKVSVSEEVEPMVGAAFDEFLF